MVGGYEAPTVTELGSLDDLTLAHSYKNHGAGDVIVTNGFNSNLSASTLVNASS